MRHQSNRLRLAQKPAHAALLQRNLVTSLVLYESIRTTRKRARVLQPLIDGLITIAKTKTPHVAIRAISQQVADKNANRKLMEVLAKRYATRTSGFTRVVAVGARKGDGAELVDITLIDAVLASDAVAADVPKKQPKKPTQPKAKKSSSVPSVASDSSKNK